MLWLFALPVVFSSKLTWKQNEALKGSCGARFISDPVLVYPKRIQDVGPKFLAMGSPVDINEFPFIAALSFRSPKCYGDPSNCFRNCTGVQISPRHIMTAAHCVVRYDPFQLGRFCKIMRPERIPKVIVEPKLITAYVGSTCPPSGSCSPRGNEYKGYAVLVHPYFDICKPANDIAIIELTNEISPMDGIPICMAEPDVTIAGTLESAGFGMNPYFYSNPRAPGLQLVKLTKRREADGKIETATRNVSLCRGDSGGPLFQSDKQGRETLVGIASTIEPFCVEVASVRRNYFIDVRPNLKWICDYTGVCPNRPLRSDASSPSSETNHAFLSKFRKQLSDGFVGIPDE